MTHVHAIGRKNRGRFVSPHLRCVNCGKTTNNKPHIKCSASDEPGGHICLDCKIDLSLDENFICTELNKHNNNGCFDCGKAADLTFSCAVCFEEKCQECILDESFEMFINTGSNYLICCKCYPPEFTEKDDFEKIEFICDIPTRFCFICREREQVDNDILLCGFNPSDEPKVYLDVLKYHEAKNAIPPTHSTGGVAAISLQPATATPGHVPATARTSDSYVHVITTPSPPCEPKETLNFSLPKTKFIQHQHPSHQAEIAAPIAIHKTNKIFMEQEINSKNQSNKIAALESELAELKLSFKLVKLNAREPPIRTDKYFVCDASTNVKPNDIKKDYADLRRKRAMFDSIVKPESNSANEFGGPVNHEESGGHQSESSNNRFRPRRPNNGFQNRNNSRKQSRTHMQFQN